MSSSNNNAINSISTLFLNNTTNQPITLCSGGGLTTISNGLTSTAGTTNLGTTNTGTLNTGNLTIADGFSFTITTGNLTNTSGNTTLGTTIINSSGTLSLLNTLASTSTITGSLIAAGGVGISGAVYIGGGLNSSATLNTLGATTFNANVNMNSNTITNLATPLNPGDAANKGYVDNAIQGLSTKLSVIATTTTSGTLSTSFVNGSIIDGVTLVTGDRILIKDQTNMVENGIYTINVTGSPTRASDFLAGARASGTYVFIEEGTNFADAGFVCTSDSPLDIIGTDNLTFVQFSGAGQIIAGTGLSKLGNTLSVNASQSQITSVGTLTSLTVGSGGLTSTAGTTNLGSSTFAGSSTINMGNNIVGNVASPISGSDAVNKTYTDSYTLLKFKQTVKATTLVDGTLATSFANGSIIDGVTLVTGDRILIKNQVTASENGIYIVNASGVPTRSIDLNTGSSASGVITFTLAGTINIGLYFICTNLTGSDIVGTNNLTFDSYTTALAGTGLTKVGSTFSVNASQSQITSLGTLTSLNVNTSITTGSLVVNSKNITPSANDIFQEGTLTYSGALPLVTTDVTGLFVSNTTCRTFKAMVSVTILTSNSLNLYQLFDLIAIQNASGFVLISENYFDSTPVTFTITSGGQIRYAIGSLVNGGIFVSAKLAFRLTSLTI